MHLLAVLLLREKNCHPRAAVPVYFQIYLRIKWMPTKSHHNDAGFMPLFIFWPLKKYRTSLGVFGYTGNNPPWRYLGSAAYSGWLCAGLSPQGPGCDRPMQHSFFFQLGMANSKCRSWFLWWWISFTLAWWVLEEGAHRMFKCPADLLLSLRFS